MHRFHEAIQFLNGGLNLMNQLTCEINWPGTDIVIDETQTGKLEVQYGIFNKCP